MARKAAAISILQAEAHALIRLRVSAPPDPLRVLAFDVRTGSWSQEDASLAKALADFSRELHLEEDEIHSMLPRHLLTTRILNLPSQDPDEITSMIALSAEEWVPFANDELVIDHVILQKLNSGEARVLVALAHQDLVQGHVRLLREAGLEPSHIYLSTACLAAAVQAGAGGNVPERFALVNLAVGGLEILVFHSNRLDFGRGLAINTVWPEDEAGISDAMTDLAMEVRGTLATYRRESEDGAPVEQIYIAGDATDPVPYVEPMANETAKEVAVASFGLRMATAGQELLNGVPLALLGAALSARGAASVVVDLVPDSVTRSRAVAGTRQRLIKLAAVGAVLFVGFAVLYAQAVLQRQAYVAELREQIAAIEPSAKGIEEKELQLRILREQVARSGSLLEMLATLADAAPEEGLNITRISFDREEGLDVWGIASEVDLVHRFAQSIRGRASDSLQFFRQARSLYEQEWMERNEKVYVYQVSVPLQAELEAEGEGEGGGGDV